MPISVIGAGAWGTALAVALAEQGKPITLWAREAEVLNSIREKQENILFLPGIVIPSSVQVTNDLSNIANSKIILVVVPSAFVAATAKKLSDVALAANIPLVLCSKGIEAASGSFMSDLIAHELSNPVAVLSGPTFAAEVARGKATSVMLASKDYKIAEDLSRILQTDHFKIYPSNDIIGVQIGGAIKNVYAIASGIMQGAGLGENARAAFLTKALDEMRLLIKAAGGNESTAYSLAGLGDLLLTATSATSRNTSLGIALGKGESLEHLLKTRSSVAEGVYAANSALVLAKKNGAKLPIAYEIERFLSGKISLEECKKLFI